MQPLETCVEQIAYTPCYRQFLYVGVKQVASFCPFFFREKQTNYPIFQI
jgi:hypothetical protein